MPLLPLIALALFLALFGGRLEAADVDPAKSDADFAKSLVSDLQSRNFDALLANADTAIRGKGANLAQMAELIPPTPPTSVQIAGSRVSHLATTRGPRIRRV